MHSSIVTIRREGESAMGWQRDFFKGEAPVAPDDLTALSAEQLEAALEETEQLRALVPGELGVPLDEQMSRLRFQIQSISEAADEERRAKLREQVEEWKALEYNPTASYPVSELEGMISQAEGFLEDLGDEPELAGAVGERLATMKTHLGHLEAGRQYLNGEWVDLEEIRSGYYEREAQEMREFFEGLNLTMPSVAVGATATAVIFGPAVMVLVFFLLILGQLVVQRSLPKGWFNWVALVVILGLLAYNLWFMLGVFEGKQEIADYGLNMAEEIQPLPETQLGRMLYISSAPEVAIAEESDRTLPLVQDEINAALRSHLTYRGVGEEGMLEMARRANAFIIEPTRLVVLDTLEFMGRRTLMQTHVLVSIQDENIDFYDFEVWLGDSKLPKVIAAHVWKQLRPQFRGLLEQMKIGDYYGIQNIEPGKVEMLMVQPPGGWIDVETEMKRIAHSESE